ncbi:unnamed protein product, partial [Musa textilis]
HPTDGDHARWGHCPCLRTAHPRAVCLLVAPLQVVAVARVGWCPFCEHRRHLAVVVPASATALVGLVL